jgi:hypothetical protein
MGASRIDELIGCSGMAVVVVLPGGWQNYHAANASFGSALARAAVLAGALKGTKLERVRGRAPPGTQV